MKDDLQGGLFHRRLPPSLLVVMTLVPLALTACFVDRSGLMIPWAQTDVYPQYVCPGESVTVSWDMGVTGGCLSDSEDIVRECYGYATISSSPNVFSPPAPSDARVASEVVSISTDTTFTFNARKDGNDWTPVDITASVIAPFTTRTFPLNFPGICTGSIASWAALEMDRLTSPNVDVEQLCNTSGDFISIRSSLGIVELLEPGECTFNFNGRPGTLTVTPFDLSLAGGATCSPTIIMPPGPVRISVDLRCTSDSGMGGATEPIVIGTPDPTPELATILTNTPESQAGIPVATFVANAFCRRGPGTGYEVVSSLSESMKANIEGRNDGDPRWWFVRISNTSVLCWVAGSTVTKEGPIGEVALIEPPPLPTETAEPTQVVAPNAPGNLQIAEVCNQSEYTVTLSWQDNADNEDGYRVYYDGNLIATLGPNANSYVYSVPSSSAATYAVEAFNSAGASAQVTVNEDGCLV